MGADQSSTRAVYRQVHENAISAGEPSAVTTVVLHRYDQARPFAKSPDSALQFLHRKALQTGEPEVLFALAELNYLQGERVRRSAKPWEPRDARDYYLASAVYAWFFLFRNPTNALSFAFDDRLRTACDLYNHGLGWALTGRRSTNAVVALRSGTRNLPTGRLEMSFSQPGFPWALGQVSKFILADQYLVRGLSVRNRQPGLGAPLIAVGQTMGEAKLARNMPVTVFLRIEGGFADLSSNGCRASLELYTPFVTNHVTVASRLLPLETDLTAPLAYSLNQSAVWKLGMGHFLSAREMVPSDIYLMRPYQPGRVPVVFVHGTFSSPIWWAEMLNALSADPVLLERCQFWFFIYNSGNPIPYSANRLREALTEKLKQLDPEGKDPALEQMVVVGHSQGGLLAKLTATDTADLWRDMGHTNLEGLNLTEKEEALLRRYTLFEPLPFVTRVVFISTPHRGSYLANNFARKFARGLVTLPTTLMQDAGEVTGLTAKLQIQGLKGVPTSLDSMSPKNKYLLKLAEIPLAPAVKGHSIVAIRGAGDYHNGSDGVVTYQSAHVNYVESEFIVRGPHSCQSQPPVIEEVRRILHEHLSHLSVSASSRNSPGATSPALLGP